MIYYFKPIIYFLLSISFSYQLLTVFSKLLTFFSVYGSKVPPQFDFLEGFVCLFGVFCFVYVIFIDAGSFLHLLVKCINIFKLCILFFSCAWEASAIMVMYDFTLWFFCVCFYTHNAHTYVHKYKAFDSYIKPGLGLKAHLEFKSHKDCFPSIRLDSGWGFNLVDGRFGLLNVSCTYV